MAEPVSLQRRYLANPTVTPSNNSFYEADTGSQMRRNSRPQRLEKKTALAKNAFGVEMLGRGLGYSFQYDRSLTPEFGFGAGLSYIQLGLEPGVGKAGTSIYTVPIYGNYYPVGRVHRALLTAGVTILQASGGFEASLSELVGPLSTEAGDADVSLDFGAQATIPTFNFGAGYEFRSQSGLLFRTQGYGIVLLDKVFPWLGVSFGFTI
jgi:hypothetical protein